ncbi:cytochrome P450, partial [Imleria badia]
DLIYTRLLGKDIIVINSEKVAKELLEHRSRNYSDRPYLITNELCGTDFNSGLLPYGDRWRLHRRFFHQTFRSDAVSRFRSLQFRKSCQLLQELLNSPDQFSEHVFDYTASLIMNGVYDYDPTSQQDEIIGVVAKVLEVIMDTIQPRVAFIVGTFPIRMSFKKKMATAKEFMNQYVEKPFEHSVKKLVGLGDTVTDEAWLKDLKGAAASAFLGGVETSTSVLVTFFLMMVLNPGAQEKAQVQIDLVLGRDRLPTIDDRPSLPYVDAILRELYRSNPIPLGAVLFINLWSMAHDESKYPDPDKFIPERFLADDGSLLPNDTKHLTFGFGRRICPGRHFADTSIWSAISTVLAMFCISKPNDANGVEIPVGPKFPSGLSVHPLPFACSIVPRTPGMDAKKLEQLIAATTTE